MVVFIFSVFHWKYVFGQVWSKKSNCQFELKFGTKTNLNMHNAIVVFNFSVLDQRNPFWTNQVQKNQNCQFKLKFGTRNNWNMRNSMMIFFFSVFDHKYPSWVNLFQKFKIACSKWNLIQSLIQICKIQWWCPFYLF